MGILKKEKICDFIEIILGLLVILQAIKKGGFYISDMNYIFVIILVLTVIYVAIKIINRKLKLNLGTLIIFFLSFAYLLPVIFKKYVDFNQAIWEAFKYVELLCIYIIVSSSNNFKKYDILLVILGVVIGIFGIDQISGRYLENILKVINSGYLSSYLERLSSTIQYANTAGILLMISYLFGIKKVFEYINKLQSDYNMSNIVKTKYLFYCSSFLLLCILLTQSRGIIIITVIGTFLLTMINENKKNKTIYYIFEAISFVLSFITSSIIDKYIYTDYMYIYLIVAIYILALAIVYNILLSKVVMNVKLWYKLENLNGIINKKSIILFFTLLCIYVILALNVTTAVTLEQNTKNLTYTKSLNVTNKDEVQNIQIEVKHLTQNLKYEVGLYELLSDNKERLITSFNEFGNQEGKFSKAFNIDSSSKKIILKFNITEGKIDISKISYNGENIKLNYIFIPTSLVERFSAETFSSTSSIVRREYIKDAFKIFKTSPIIGRGGEAFRYLYKEFQEGNYISTEVHSSFMQILVESGILGEICIIAFCIFVIITGKNKAYKAIFILFIIHSMFDLNFSYTISVMVFGILAGMLANTQKETTSTM